MVDGDGVHFGKPMSAAFTVDLADMGQSVKYLGT